MRFILALLAVSSASSAGMAKNVGPLQAQNLFLDIAPEDRAAARTNLGVGSVGTLNLGTGLTSSGGTLSANVATVFGRTGAVTLGSGDVTGALGFTPAALDGSGGVSAANFKIGGSNALSAGPASTQYNLSVQSMFIGHRAGELYPLSSDSGYGSIGIGAMALAKLTALSAENVAVGVWACPELTGTLATCVGMHAGGQERSASGSSYFGNDSGRDQISDGYVFAAGANSLRNGNAGPGTIAIGALAAQGNSTAIILSGTVTAGNTVTVNLTSAVPGLTGLPFAYTYTVQAGDTLVTIAAAIASHITGISGPHTALGALSGAVGDGTAYVALYFPGNKTLGWAITTAATVSGGATVAAAVTNGARPLSFTAIGSHVAQSPVMAVSNNNVFLGDYVAGMITTANYNVVAGSGSAGVFTSSSANALYGALIAPTASTLMDVTASGFWALKNATAVSALTVSGSRSAQACITCRNSLISGFNVGSATFATGAGVILIGSGNQAVDTPAGGTSNYLNIENVIVGTALNAPASSILAFAGAAQVGSTAALTLSGGEFGLQKIAASGTAPGAAGGKLALVCSGTAGKAKLVVSAGTSGTATTIVDNIGTGVTGC